MTQIDPSSSAAGSIRAIMNMQRVLVGSVLGPLSFAPAFADGNGLAGKLRGQAQLEVMPSGSEGVDGGSTPCRPQAQGRSRRLTTYRATRARLALPGPRRAARHLHHIQKDAMIRVGGVLIKSDELLEMFEQLGTGVGSVCPVSW